MTEPAGPRIRADVVVAAGGTSRRMGGIDKLEAPVAGRSLLAWTLANLAASGVERIVVVVPADRLDAVRDARWLPSTVAAVVAGGPRRQESVAAGIGAVAGLGAPPERIVLVHDAARPLVAPSLVARVAVAVERHGAAVPVIPVTDTLKRVAGVRVVGTVDRTELAAAQTPQGARLELFEAAYRQFPAAGPTVWTDEAALLEACTIPVQAVPGDPGNVKVTVPDDLARVRHALAEATPARIGFGVDSHAFGPGGPLRLGGVTISGAPRLSGHSDGDVALHAVADAMLGGACLGDLGRHFPATAATPEGIPSGELLSAVRDRVAHAGYRPVTVDVTVIGARPRLGGRLDAMRDAIAGLVRLDPGRVSVKASSGNLLGPEGAGRAISAQAVVLLEPIP